MLCLLMSRGCFHSPLDTSFLLSPFPFFLSTVAAPCCSIKLSKVGVQTRALGSRGAEHFFPSGKPSIGRCWHPFLWVEFLSVDQLLALSEISEILVTNDSYVYVILMLKTLSFYQRITSLWHEDCLSLARPQVVFLPKGEFSADRSFSVNHAPFCDILLFEILALDTV